MKDIDSEQFLDSVMVIERDTVPVEFYGNPNSIFNTVGAVERIKDSIYIEVPTHCAEKLHWAPGDKLQWDIVDQETVIITRNRR